MLDAACGTAQARLTINKVVDDPREGALLALVCAGVTRRSADENDENNLCDAVIAAPSPNKQERVEDAALNVSLLNSSTIKKDMRKAEKLGTLMAKTNIHNIVAEAQASDKGVEKSVAQKAVAEKAADLMLKERHVS